MVLIERTAKTYIVKYIANAFRKKTDICSFAPYKEIQRKQKKLPFPINGFETVQEKYILEAYRALIVTYDNSK